VADQSSVEIHIRDDGPGIPDEVQERIFDPFFTTKGDDDSTPGMGLGLSMVRSIVRGLGGRVEFETSPGQGTVFHVSLPLNLVPKEP